jgi:hypothetical protein
MCLLYSFFSVVSICIAFIFCAFPLVLSLFICVSSDTNVFVYFSLLVFFYSYSHYFSIFILYIFLPFYYVCFFPLFSRSKFLPVLILPNNY